MTVDDARPYRGARTRLRLRLPAQDGVPAARPAAPARATSGPSEPREPLFLYLHVPFCEMRCGFCNLFTRSNPPAELVAPLPRRRCDAQAEATREALRTRRASPPARSAAARRPTSTADELERLFDIAAIDGRGRATSR